jgi:hypothetical protein
VERFRDYCVERRAWEIARFLQPLSERKARKNLGEDVTLGALLFHV